MSVKVMAHVFGIVDKRLSPQDRLVLLAYVDHADEDGCNIYPAVATVATKTGYSERTIQRRTRNLEEAGLLIPDGNVYLDKTRGTGLNKWRYNWLWVEPQEKVSDCHPKQKRVTTGAEKGDIPDKKGDRAMAPDPSLEPSLEPSLLEPQTAGSQWLFSEILKIITAHNSTDAPRKKRAARKFQNIKQKEMIEQAERRLGLREFQRAADYYFAKGIMGIGDLSARIANWSGNSKAKPEREQPQIGVPEISPGVW